MSITPNNFNDCHVFSLPSQGSIYTMCRLPNSNPYGRIKLLAASSRRPVYLLEFNQDNQKSLVPYSRELSFTNLSGNCRFPTIFGWGKLNCFPFNDFRFLFSPDCEGNAEIVSITSFAKPGSPNITICVSYIKVGLFYTQ